MAPKPEMGKYLLWLFFRRSSKVRPYLPATKRYSASSLKAYLDCYQTVYVKPVAGSMGRGILKVWRSNGKIVVQKTTLPRKVFASATEAGRYIDAQREGKAYIVQQGLALARVHGRPFDIRIMMQRVTPGGDWLQSGLLAKVAGSGSVVTNVALSRGSVMTVEQALRQSLGWGSQEVERCIRKLKQIAYQAAQHFDSYQSYRELGFDMAVDKQGKIWMIEQNTGPSHALFARLKSNLSMYRTIQWRWGQFERARRVRKTIKHT